MKRIISLAFISILTISLNTSCRMTKNANKTQKGAVIGAAGGAVIGGLIGGNIKGALIGAAIGGVAGGIIGHLMDLQAKKIKKVLPGAEVYRVGEGIQVIFDDKSGVNFAFNSAELTREAQRNLDKISEIFIEFPQTELMIEGHTDNTGEDDFNMNLSERRAQSVSGYLEGKKIASRRMTLKGFGESAPRFSNETAEGRAKNRRVEIGIAANKEMIDAARAQAK